MLSGTSPAPAEATHLRTVSASIQLAGAMPERHRRGPSALCSDCRVRVVEDEYLIAQDLARLLRAHRAILLGPVPSLEKVLALMQQADWIDGAKIGINLRD